jgi:hypothetical protein
MGSITTASIVYDAEHWRDRAEEARLIAEQKTDSHSRTTMLDIAAGYEMMAEFAAARREGRNKESD